MRSRPPGCFLTDMLELQREFTLGTAPGSDAGSQIVTTVSALYPRTASWLTWSIIIPTPSENRLYCVSGTRHAPNLLLHPLRFVVGSDIFVYRRFRSGLGSVLTHGV